MASFAASTGRPASMPLRPPSITLGENLLLRAGMPGDVPMAAVSGMRITSSARARWGRRRRKPRSSSPVISRWMPDFERRLSASFISSKLGETPDSAIKSLM